MASTTGAPLNLNKFEGGDLVGQALTTLFNQNMDKLNGADPHAQVWQPNHAYLLGDIALHPFKAKLMYAYTSHTSSDAKTTINDWASANGNNWATLNWQPLVGGSDTGDWARSAQMFFEASELRQFTTSGTIVDDAWMYKNSRSMHKVPSFRYNTKYEVGDIVYVSQMGSTTTGMVTGGLFRALKAHTSGSTFPASSTGTWELLNARDSYYAQWSGTGPYGIPLWVHRHGSMIQYTTNGSIVSTIPAGGWKDASETLPEIVRPNDSVYHHVYKSSDAGGSLSLQSSGKISFSFNTQTNSGTALYGTSVGQAGSKPVWNAGTVS